MRRPDLSLIDRARLPGGRVPRGKIDGAPDLAVEVVSPTDTSAEVQDKAREYLRLGCSLVWVIDPQGEFALVFEPDRAPRPVAADGRLDGGRRFPTLGILLREVLEA